MNIVQNENNIWITKNKDKPSYADEGHGLLFKLEDKRFWFIHRNQIFRSVINRFPFQKNFAYIAEGNLNAKKKRSKKCL